MIGLYVLTGILIGGALGWFFWWSAHREALRLEEEKDQLKQEQMIVFEFMHNMVESIGEGVDRQKLLEDVVHAAVLSTGALSACIFEHVDDKLRGAAMEGLFPPHRPLPPHLRTASHDRVELLANILKSEVFDVGEGLVGTVAKTGEGIYIRDALEDPRVIKHDDPALRIRSVIVVPVHFRERSLAVLAIVNSSDGGSFSGTDFSLALSLAEQAGLAIHNLDTMSVRIEKNKLDNDLSLAREVQTMLLPQPLSESTNLEIGITYRPAQKVGGDFYDYFPLGDDCYGFAVADVSGKGIPASLMMAIAQTHLRHFAEQSRSPGKVLSLLNRQLHGAFHENMFVTVLYAVIDLRNNRLSFARGGHEQPILWRKEEKSGHLLDAPGMALALFDPTLFDEQIEDTEIDFCPGDALVLYTDGVTEACNAEGEEYSNRRLLGKVEENAESGAEEINRVVMEDVARFSSSLQWVDDFTLLAIKRRTT